MPNSQPLPPEIPNIGEGDQDRLLALEILDERLYRYRLVQPKLPQQTAQSLKDYGQVSEARGILFRPVIPTKPQHLAVALVRYEQTPKSPNKLVVVPPQS